MSLSLQDLPLFNFLLWLFDLCSLSWFQKPGNYLLIMIEVNFRMGKSSFTQIFVCLVGCFFCYLCSSYKICPMEGMSFLTEGKKKYIWHLETWRLLLSANDVPGKCLGTTEKAFTDSNIALHSDLFYVRAPEHDLFFFISHPLQYSVHRNQDKSVSSTSSRNLHSLWSSCGPWI